APAPSASPHSAPPSAPTAPANPPAPAPAPDAIGLTGEVAVLSPSPPEPSAPFISPEVVPPSHTPSPEPFTAPPSELPSLEPANPDLPPAASPVPEATPAVPNDPITPLPSTSPTPPGFITSQIDVPIPDVSETLTLPDATVDPNSLAQTGINQTATPLQLMANLTIDRFVDAAEQPETIATLVDDITSQEISDPKTSACLSALQPAILPALGTAVVLQVGTDATGQVTQTTVQQSSQNAAYDALAQCAVEHWRFNPATDQGVPVTSNALQVRVTIDSK
ncbi:MAG TPA: energy transducer TonB, partial [Allocoleopsis sp.]